MNTPLFVAAWNNDLTEVQRLLKSGSDINERHENLTPLYAAIENCSLECLDYLLESGVDLELEFGQFGLCSPLNWTIDTEITASTEGLWSYGNLEGNDLMPVPVLSSRLLAAGANPDKVDSTGSSPRRNAEERHHLSFLALLTNIREQATP